MLRFPTLAAIKHLLALSRIDCGAPVLPRRVLSAEEEVRLREELAAAGFEAGALHG